LWRYRSWPPQPGYIVQAELAHISFAELWRYRSGTTRRRHLYEGKR
jgi:hypothetical protein